MGIHFSLQANRSIGFLPPAPCIFSPQGPARCAHHLLLLSDKDLASGKSNACGFCNPDGNKINGKFVMPTFCDHPLGDSERVYANASAGPGQCPACRSRIHIVETNGAWHCADCRAKIRTPKNLKAETENEVEVGANE